MKLIIRNGHVIDATTDEKRDILVEGTHITGQRPEGELMEIDAEGCYVFPGLIDFHAHLFSEGSQVAVYPDSMIPNGVTTAIDAGTSGCSAFCAQHVQMVQSQCKVYSFLSVYTGGIFSGDFQENYDPELFDREAIKALKEKYPEEIKGLKIRIGEETIGALSLKALEQTVSLADEIGSLRVCVHVSNSAYPQEEVVKLLRRGDIFCHVYQGTKNNILDSRGKVKREIWDARERGVIFDAAHGRWNFSHKVAEAAMGQGFLPDTISSDVTSQRYRWGCHAKSLPFIMSKFMAMGMELPDIIERVTKNPAALLGISRERGTLKAGAAADIVIFKKKRKRVKFMDFEGNIIWGEEILVPQMTIKDGEIRYCQEDFFL